MNDSSHTAAALEALARIVGAAHVLTDPALIASHLVEPRGLYRGKALGARASRRHARSRGRRRFLQ